jgi:hypothetical protein
VLSVTAAVDVDDADIIENLSKQWPFIAQKNHAAINLAYS